ncbi:MAG: M23 family metallopeptidase [Pseudomonadota bacterium]
MDVQSNARKGRRWAPFFLAVAYSTLRSAAAIALFSAVPQKAVADPPRLALPVACTLGETCYIQQYMDRRAGPGVEDFACGALANDGHSGTDFAVPSEAAMRAGVAVLAAADGTVLGTRDGMPDIRQDVQGAPDVTGVECGNGLVLDHGDGWHTQYCHLRRGSLRVRSGDVVRQGAELGEIGMSGRATFPHVHVSLRHNGAEVDPFQPDPAAPCGTRAAALWQSDIAYFPGGPIAAGLATGVPEYDAVKAGLPEDGLTAAAPAAVLWVFIANARAGDVLSFEIDGPAGRFGVHEVTIDRTQPLRMQAFGRRAPGGGLPDGAWTGRITQHRDGAELGRINVQARVP